MGREKIETHSCFHFCSHLKLARRPLKSERFRWEWRLFQIRVSSEHIYKRICAGFMGHLIVRMYRENEESFIHLILLPVKYYILEVVYLLWC